jgi:hypothetical protein
MNECHRGFALNCGLPSKHDGPCVTQLLRNGNRLIAIVSEPPIVRQIPTVAETLRRLDLAIANVRRFA